MKTHLPALVLASFLSWCGPLGTMPLRAEVPSENADGVAFFEKKIRPLLARHCYECHSADAKTLQGGLRLDDPARIRAGGDSGPVVAAGDVDGSLVVQAVRHEIDGIEMPPDGKLPELEIAAIREWVRMGAPLPATGGATPRDEPIDFAAARKFWSFRPVENKPRPKISRPDWPRRRIDHFILARLDEQGLEPSAEEERRRLIRRVSFDLVGLPPSPEEVDRFVKDDQPDAYERLIERLLESPHFGERWARHWLDLVRYTDKTATWLKSTGQAWLYRDWVINALNDDLPYDQFVRLQLAADQMEDAQPADRAALGLLGLSPTYWKELQLPPEIIKVIVADEWEERIDAVSRTFLGLTVACARCHDHKFDPITMEDYYALAGVFASTRLTDVPLIPDEPARAALAAQEKVKQLEAELKKLSEKKPPAEDLAEQTAALKQQIEELKQTPHYDMPLAHAVDDAAIEVLPAGEFGTKIEYAEGEAHDLPLFIRGNPSRHGSMVERRFLELFQGEAEQRFQRGSGRLELAEAIVGSAGPLAARVIVNRVWREHFGRGLVETPSNFGMTGAPPSHPDLLDDLAARFIANGWSLKWLHREIVLSATYRQSSRHDAKKERLDPENRWLSRANRRRLSIEAWRDAMLSASGELQRTVGGPPLVLQDAANHRRTIYGEINRRDLDVMLRLYDFPDPTSHRAERQNTTTPLQQLFVLNGPLVAARSAAFAKRMLEADAPTDADRIALAYRLLFAREPAEKETELSFTFLAERQQAGATAEQAWQEYAQVLFGSNEFMFVD